MEDDNMHIDENILLEKGITTSKRQTQCLSIAWRLFNGLIDHLTNGDPSLAVSNKEYATAMAIEQVLCYIAKDKDKLPRESSKKRMRPLNRLVAIVYSSWIDVERLFNDHFSHLKLKKQENGYRYYCFSPFADEKKRSCMIDPFRGTWKDYSLWKGWKFPHLLKEVSWYSFVEAVNILQSYLLSGDDKELLVEEAESRRKKNVR